LNLRLASQTCLKTNATSVSKYAEKLIVSSQQTLLYFTSLVIELIIEKVNVSISVSKTKAAITVYFWGIVAYLEYREAA